MNIRFASQQDRDEIAEIVQQLGAELSSSSSGETCDLEDHLTPTISELECLSPEKENPSKK